MPHELLVVNKTDAAGDLQLARLRHLLPGAVFVSASRGDGISRLRTRIAELLPRPEVDVELLLPYVEGSLVARVHAEGEVLTEEHTADGTKMHARVGAELATAVLPFAVAGAPGDTNGVAH
jgi:GTPase